MKLASLLSVLALPACAASLLLAACASKSSARPDLAQSEVVVLVHRPADEVAARVCSLLHGVDPDAKGRPAGCSLREHDGTHRHEDGTTHVSLIADAGSNSIVIAAPPGHAADLARAVSLVRELDTPAAKPQ